MVFGVLKDIKVGENRVICTPIEVATIVGAGHKVLVQKDAGVGSGFSNEAYSKAGAELRRTAMKNGMTFVEEYDDPVNVRTLVYAIDRNTWEKQCSDAYATRFDKNV